MSRNQLKSAKREAKRAKTKRAMQSGATLAGQIQKTQRAMQYQRKKR